VASVALAEDNCEAVGKPTMLGHFRMKAVIEMMRILQRESALQVLVRRWSMTMKSVVPVSPPCTIVTPLRKPTPCLIRMLRKLSEVTLMMSQGIAAQGNTHPGTS
jgi:hypothetical protein